MTITAGSRLPEATFTVMGTDGPGTVTTSQVFAGKKIVLFGVPGAFTPTCHRAHMPGFVARFEELKAKGVDAVACTAVNDIFVLTAWARETGADGKILMLADGNAEFARKAGLDADLSEFGLGVRSRRYAMLVDGGTVKILNIEEQPGRHEKSSAAALCSALDCAL